MGDARERQEVMFAQRIDRYVLHDDHFVVRFRGYYMDQLAWILVQARANLFVHERDPPWSALEARAVRVLADAFQNKPNAGLDLLEVHSGRRFPFFGGVTLSGIRHRPPLLCRLDHHPLPGPACTPRWRLPVPPAAGRPFHRRFLHSRRILVESVASAAPRAPPLSE